MFKGALHLPAVPLHITAAVILILPLLLVQSGAPAMLRKTPATSEDDPALHELRREGNVLFRSGEYLRAIQIYESGYQESKRRGLKQSAARFLNNLGGAYYQIFRFRDAIQVYLEARDLAIAQGDLEAWGALCSNLSSLYFQMGDYEASLNSASQGLRLLSGVTAKYRPQLLIQAARIRWQQSRSPQALEMFHQAIDGARAQLDTANEAQAWNELGNALLEARNFDGAQRALLEAYRLRKLTHNDRLYFVYDSLGNLRVAQHDLDAAATLFDRALEAARTVSPSATWSIYYDRGKVRLAQGQLIPAYEDFGAALECLRRWRTEILPADAFRVSADVDHHQVYAAYINLASHLYAQTGQQRFAEDAFAAAEESRAASLRALWAGSDLTRKLPKEYWEALASLHRAEAAVIKGGPAEDAAAVRARRVRVAEIEARAGLDLVETDDTSDNHGRALDRARQALGPDEVFLGFHLGDAESYLWVIAREGFALRRLPSRDRIADSVKVFEQAVRENTPGFAELAQRTYSELFDGPGAAFLKKKSVWIVAPEGPLFTLPFAALMEPPQTGGGAPSFVVERHGVRVVPGSWALSGAGTADWNGPVVGLGDPIYNRADPRLRYKQAITVPGPGKGTGPGLELARLAGSSREIENCARVWRAHGVEPVLLRGADATRDNLARALQRNPAIVHVAAHLLFPPEISSPALLALAPANGTDVELLSATEIGGMRFKAGVVVLNGCASGRAAALPGAGLMGMTRAWLAAGARAVIATRWSTSDHDEGRLFQSFYERLSTKENNGNRKSFAELLREAQINELHAGGRRANPAYWAAYFCVERS